MRSRIAADGTGPIPGRRGQLAGGTAAGRSVHAVVRALLVLSAMLVLFALAASPAPAGVAPVAPGGNSGSSATALSRTNPVRATVGLPHSERGTPAVGDPRANVAPVPNFFESCSGSAYDNSAGCVDATLRALGHARATEGLPAMVLPTTWGALSPQQQLFVATNLERTVRGLPPMWGMAQALNRASEQAAAQNQDPWPPPGFGWTRWGSNWAAGVGNPLEALYLWMYDDGPGSSNIACTPADPSGCWGHRNNILQGMRCAPCYMGAGFSSSAWQGRPSWTELLVDATGFAPLDFSWNQVLPQLPGAPGGARLLAPAVGMTPTPDGNGYWLVDAGGGTFAFGDASFHGSMAGMVLARPVVGMAATPSGGGYWLVASDGGIFTFGDAQFLGSTGAVRLARPVVGMAATPSGGGYWLVASDGGIFTFGDASFRGSTGATVLNAPVVSMAAPSSAGYWLVASDGGVFSFGDAPFRGSMG